MIREGDHGAVSGLGFALSVFLLTSLFVVNPNEALVLQLFDKYVGTQPIVNAGTLHP
jgi:regulator of protease activity HflC (stomatin/prohibitin superfamily)